jgi:hypothetical protein
MDPFTTGTAVASSILPLLFLPYLLLLLAFPYAVLRLRDAQNRTPDPQLGFKAALQFFFSLAILLILTGITIIVVDAILQIGQLPRQPPVKGFPKIGEREFPNAAQRVAGALVVAGILFAGVFLLLILALTGGPSPSPARRTFLGARCAVHGLVVMISLTALLVVFFIKTEPGINETNIWEVRKTLIAILLVWGPSSVIHFSLFRLISPALPEQPQRRDQDWVEEGDGERNA